MQPTRNTLSESIRTQAAELLNTRLIAMIDPYAQVKAADRLPALTDTPRRVRAERSDRGLGERRRCWRRSEPMKTLRILIVEDDVLIGIYLAEMLVAMGYDVCAIEATEADAVTSAVQHRPDLMIIDARLRNGNGIAALEQILRVFPLPHVFVTGDVSSVETSRPGAVVLRKPFRESDLARAIQRAFGVAAAS
jgi:two-component system, response regulator PdtaR